VAPETLVHYTTAAGLLGILTKKSIWATDLRFLNDATELSFARETVNTKLEARKRAEVAIYTREDEARACSEFFDLFLEGSRASQSFCDYGVYVACFCREGDLLSQWRGYGGDHGYSVEFPANAIEGAIEAMPRPVYPAASGLFRVRYGLEAAESLAETAGEVVARATQKGSSSAKKTGRCGLGERITCSNKASGLQRGGRMEGDNLDHRRGELRRRSDSIPGNAQEYSTLYRDPI